MMRKLFFALTILITYSLYANVAPRTSGEITEIYFNNIGSWTIEITYDIVNSWDEDTIYICSSTDTSALITFPTIPGIYTVTNNSLKTPLSINKSGDELSLMRNEYGGQWWEPVSEVRFMWGDFPGAQVNAPQPGQTLVGLPDLFTTYNQACTAKDSAPSLGNLVDPTRGTIKGYVYDSLMNPMPYQLLHIDGILDRLIWTDENGFFEDTTVYGMNYELYVTDNSNNQIGYSIFTVEPDSITNVELVLPLSRDISVSGRIIPENQQMTLGSYAIFTPLCPTAPIDTFLTDSDGYFNAEICCGNYYVRYSREEHIPAFWPNAFTFFNDYDLGQEFLQDGFVVEVERGEKEGSWNGDMPYFIFGDISIDEGDTLELLANSHLVFCGDYLFTIEGTLLANGTENDRIWLITHSSVSSWQLCIQGESASGTTLDYSTVQNVDNFEIHDASPELNHMGFSNMQLSIAGQSAPNFYNSVFDSFCNILAKDYANPTFRKSFLTNPGETIIDLLDHANANFEYNTIYYSWCVAANWDDSTSVSFIGNIFHKAYPTYFTAPDELRYNLFYESWTSTMITTVNYNGDSCDSNYNLFDYDPLFIDPENGNFHLLAESPCIDAGDPTSPYDPDSTIADIGAYYYDQLNTYVKNPISIDDQYEIKVIPNPNRGDFSISVISPIAHLYEARLNIYSINGSIIDHRNIAVLDKGKNLFCFAGLSGDQSGLHICTLEIDGRVVASTKMIVLD